MLAVLAEKLGELPPADRESRMLVEKRAARGTQTASG
jgi:hypothetical protein